jgi:SAM-dependent methyltransferase
MTKNNLSCQIIQKDLRQLTIRDIPEPIDIVVSFGLLEHFENRMPIYEISRRILGNGGSFIAAVPNLNFMNLSWCLKANPDLMKWHYSVQLETVLEELRNEGFVDIKGAYVGGFRLFACGRNWIFQTVKRAVNICGETVSRFANISSKRFSPYFMASGTTTHAQ